MLNNNRVIGHFRNLHLIEKLLIQGLILVAALIVFELWLSSVTDNFIAYLPPIGFALLMALTYFVQPLIIGVLNIIVINALFRTRGWQVGFWLNGVFLLLVFATLNLVLQTAFNLAFVPYVVIVDLLLCIPFGAIARFSNGGWKKPLE